MSWYHEATGASVERLEKVRLLRKIMAGAPQADVNHLEPDELAAHYLACVNVLEQLGPFCDWLLQSPVRGMEALTTQVVESLGAQRLQAADAVKRFLKRPQQGWRHGESPELVMLQTAERIEILLFDLLSKPEQQAAVAPFSTLITDIAGWKKALEPWPLLSPFSNDAWLIAHRIWAPVDEVQRLARAQPEPLEDLDLQASRDALWKFLGTLAARGDCYVAWMLNDNYE